MNSKLVKFGLNSFPLNYCIQSNTAKGCRISSKQRIDRAGYSLLWMVFKRTRASLKLGQARLVRQTWACYTLQCGGSRMFSCGSGSIFFSYSRKWKKISSKSSKTCMCNFLNAGWGGEGEGVMDEGYTVGGGGFQGVRVRKQRWGVGEERWVRKDEK